MLVLLGNRNPLCRVLGFTGKSKPVVSRFGFYWEIQTRCVAFWVLLGNRNPLCRVLGGIQLGPVTWA